MPPRKFTAPKLPMARPAAPGTLPVEPPAAAGVGPMVGEPGPGELKPKAVLKCYRPLGGIIRCFPFATHLARQGFKVFIECPAESKSILGLVDYAEWKDPATPLRDEAGVDLFQRVYDMQIFPGQIHKYRTENPAKKYHDFLESQWPADFKGMERRIIFDRMPDLEATAKKYRLPLWGDGKGLLRLDVDLACPVGSIEGQAPVLFGLFESWIADTLKLPGGQCYYLAGRGWRPNRLHVCVDDLAELATLIRHARTFSSVQAGPAVIASAYFNGKPLRESWNYVRPNPPRERAQDEVVTKGQVSWEVNLSSLCPYIHRSPDGR